MSNINMSIQPNQQSPVAPQAAQVAPQATHVAPQAAHVSPNVQVEPIYNQSAEASTGESNSPQTNNEAPTSISVSSTLLQNMKAIIHVMHERKTIKLEEMVVVGNVYNTITNLLEPNEKTV
jgi:hypothetical protein